MKITESQLRRIIRQELNEMKGATFYRDPETGEWKSGMEDFPGAGAERARKMREPTMFRRPKITDPDLGDKFDRMMASLDLDDEDEDEFLDPDVGGYDPDDLADLPAGEMQRYLAGEKVRRRG